VANNFEIKKTLIASTSHIESEDFSVLSESDVITEDYEYGTRIYLNQEYSGSCEDSIVEHISKFSFSEGFKLLILFAVSLDCDWLELDSDGPIYEELPKYEW